MNAVGVMLVLNIYIWLAYEKWYSEVIAAKY
jgi:hypothetical protein